MSTPHDGPADDQDESRAPSSEPVVGPDDVDPVDHTVDVVRIDGEDGSIPGEWL